MTEPATLPNAAPTKRARSEYLFPLYDLADCVAVAKVLYDRAGGTATLDHIAAYLNYKSTHNGALITRIANTRLFGLVQGNRDRIEITDLARQFLLPIRDTDQRQALVTAFFNVPLYKAIYEELRGDLPPEFGMKNALRTRFGIVPQRIEGAYRAFMASAETAGFFEVRGSRTQLIIPNLPQTPAPSLREDREAEGETVVTPNVGGGGGNGSRPPGPPLTRDELQNEFVATLIRLLGSSEVGEERTELIGQIKELLSRK